MRRSIFWAFTAGTKVPARTWRSVQIAGFLGAFALTACGEPEVDAFEEQRQSALGTWGSWVPVTTFGLLNRGPALAQVQTGPLSAYGRGTDNHIWFTNMDASWQWTEGWYRITSGSEQFSAPSVVAFPFTSGPLANTVAVVTQRLSDGRYLMRIQHRSGSPVIQDWSVIGQGTYIAPPAITFVPANSLTQPKNTLVLIGLGTDNRLWESRNTLSGDTYDHAAWAMRGPIHDTKFVENYGIAYKCARGSTGLPSLVIVGTTIFVTVAFTQFNGTSWSQWQESSTLGAPVGSVAVATTCANTGSETTVYAKLGTPHSNKIGASVMTTSQSGSWTFSSFTPIGTQMFNDGPTALAVTRKKVFGILAGSVAIGGSDAKYRPLMNEAVSP